MSAPLPQRRLLLRAGRAPVAVDLTQVREVGGEPGPEALHLAAVLRLPGAGIPAALLWVETGAQPVAVGVEAVGGVVEVAPAEVRPVPAATRLECPGLVRCILKVREPAAWRRTSLLPTSVLALEAAPGDGRWLLAADLDPVELGRLLLAAGRPP